MSFSFAVSGHAGPGVQATLDEGARVRRLATAVLAAGVAEGLNVRVHSFSPAGYKPDVTTQAVVPNEPIAATRA